MKFELTPYNRNIPDEDFLNDLKRVASELEQGSLSSGEYKKHDGKYHTNTIIKRFGSWTTALMLAGLIPAQPRFMTEAELFENLEEVWTRLGRQPKYHECRKPLSKYSARTYETRFGSWLKALEAFVKFMNEERDEDEQEVPPAEVNINPNPGENNFKHKTKRNVSWRLSWLIKERDNFTCKACGRSPALIPGTILHVDHIKPYSKGGETVPENLQTLCIMCNIGKSDLE